MKNNKFNYEKVTKNVIGLTIDGKIAVAVTSDTSDNTRYSHYRNDDNCSDTLTYRAYDEKKSALVDATDFVVYDLSGMSWWMPTTKIKAGDIVKKDDKYYYIISTENGRVKVINYSESKEDNLVSELNLFLNKEIFKKLVTPFSKGLEMDDQAMKFMMMSSMMNGDNTNNNGINPMMLMMMSNANESDASDNSLMKFMMMSSMMNGDNTNNNGINPMMLMMISKKGGLEDLFNINNDSSKENEEK